MYPIEKYRFYTNGNKVIAISTYAGKTVRGVAKCAPEDTFDLEKGKKIAAARCAVRVAEKRLIRADKKVEEAEAALDRAKAYAHDMNSYFFDAEDAFFDAKDYLEDLIK